MSGFDVRPASRHQPAFHLPSSSSSSSSPSPHYPAPTAETSSPSDNNDDDDDDDDDDGAPLPFPTALSRQDFLAPQFNAAEYLSSLFPGSLDGGHSSDTTTTAAAAAAAAAGAPGLGTRHQTLEDLRTELRERSSAISAELLELVNANYTAFLGLGDELKGGEDRVEDVRVALLGFRRQVEEVQSRVRGRREETGKLGAELRGVRGQVEGGRRMLELDERLDILLGRLEEREEEEEDDDDDEYDEGNDVEEREVEFTGSSPALLTELAREYVAVDKLADLIGRDLQYVRKMEERITRCRNTLLLDLGTSMKEARRAGEKGRDRVMKLLGVYRLLGAYPEGVKILKEK